MLSSRHHLKGSNFVEYVLVILIALLSKQFINSELCRGKFGFFKTYFVYGAVGAFAILGLVMLIFGRTPIKEHDIDGLADAVGLALFCLSIFLAGIGRGLYELKKRSTYSPLMNLYIILILIGFVIMLPTALFKVPGYFVVYGVALFGFYKFAWKNTLIEANA